MPAPLADPPSAPPDAAARLGAMRPKELRDWLRDRLHGRDVLLPDDGQQSLAHAVAAVDPQLDWLTRRDLRRAVAELAGQIGPDENDAPAVFTPAAAHELLLLVQHLEVQESGESLRALAEDRPRFARLPEALRERVLATLVDLGVNLPPSFWHGVFKTAPARLAGLVFDGLALLSAEAAVDFLPQVPAGKEAAEAVGFALPRFMDELVPKEQRQAIRRRIAKVLPMLGEELCREVTIFFQEEETPLERYQPVVTVYASTGPSRPAPGKFAKSKRGANQYNLTELTTLVLSESMPKVRGRILEMASRDDLSPQVMARRLNMPAAEVLKLIRQLKKKLFKTGASQKAKATSSQRASARKPASKAPSSHPKITT